MEIDPKIQLPKFSVPIRQTFEQFGTDSACTLISMDQSLHLSDDDVKTIVKICNEPLIYNFLFREKLGGESYTNKDAEEFVKWAKSGWADNTHFVFLIRNDKNAVVGCVDIKSPNLAASEIGYWASSESPGFMTNAVETLAQLAKKAGYLSLFGLVKPENIKSSGVLARNGFENVGEADRKGKKYIKFVKLLEN